MTYLMNLPGHEMCNRLALVFFWFLRRDTGCYQIPQSLIGVPMLELESVPSKVVAHPFFRDYESNHQVGPKRSENACAGWRQRSWLSA